jgi:hypothetical protein
MASCGYELISDKEFLNIRKTSCMRSKSAAKYFRGYVRGRNRNQFVILRISIYHIWANLMRPLI